MLRACASRTSPPAVASSAPSTVSEPPSACVMSPPACSRASATLPTLPRLSAPSLAVSARLLATRWRTCRSPAACVTEAAPPTRNWPSVCTKRPSTVSAPATLMRPPVCVSCGAVRLPTASSPPLPTARLARLSAPLADKACRAMLTPPAPVRLASIGASAATPSATVTSVPCGITTLATLSRMGTAPPAQLLASNQLPRLPPTQLTEFRRVMSPVRPSAAPAAST